MRPLAHLITASALMLSAPNSAAEEPEADLAELAGLMLNNYATLPDNTEQTIIDRRVAVEVEGSDAIWFYSQLNTGDDQSLYRQRFHKLTLMGDGTTIVQRSYVPRDPDRYVDGWADETAFSDLTEDDIEPALSHGCDQHWRKAEDGTWQGKVDPASCEIYSARRQTIIRIGADGFYDGHTYGTSERGFDADMNPIWGSKPGEFIPLARCQSQLCADEALALSKRSQ